MTRATLSFLAYEIELAVEEHGRLAGGVIAIFMVFIAITLALVPALGFDLILSPLCFVTRFLFASLAKSKEKIDPRR